MSRVGPGRLAASKLYTIFIFFPQHPLSFYLYSAILVVARLDACQFVDSTVPSLPCSFYLCCKIALRSSLCEACDPFTRSQSQYFWAGRKWIRAYIQHSQCRVHCKYYVGRSIYPSHAGHRKVCTSFVESL